MTGSEQQPGTYVEIDDVKAAEKRYDGPSPKSRETAWLELWYARDFTLQGRSDGVPIEDLMLQ